MIMGYVLAIAVMTSGGWELDRPVSEDLYPSYEICMSHAASVPVASDEIVVCGEVRR